MPLDATGSPSATTCSSPPRRRCTTNVRLAGSRVTDGDQLVAEGIGAHATRRSALIAEVGHDKVLARPRPRVVVLIADCGLVAPGLPLTRLLRDLRRRHHPAGGDAARRRRPGVRRGIVASTDPKAVGVALGEQLVRADLVLLVTEVTDGLQAVLGEPGLGRRRRGGCAARTPAVRDWSATSGRPCSCCPPDAVAAYLSYLLVGRPLVQKLAGQGAGDPAGVVRPGDAGGGRRPACAPGCCWPGTPAGGSRRWPTDDAGGCRARRRERRDRGARRCRRPDPGPRGRDLLVAGLACRHGRLLLAGAPHPPGRHAAPVAPPGRGRVGRDPPAFGNLVPAVGLDPSAGCGRARHDLRPARQHLLRTRPARPDAAVGRRLHPARRAAGVRRPGDGLGHHPRVGLLGAGGLLDRPDAGPAAASSRPRWRWPPTTASTSSSCIASRSRSVRRTANSLAVVRKLGARYEGRRERYMHVDGAWRDHDVFVLEADGVPGGRARPAGTSPRRTSRANRRHSAGGRPDGTRPPNTVRGVGLTGLIFAAIAAFWLMYLVPYFLRHRGDDAAEDVRTWEIPFTPVGDHRPQRHLAGRGRSGHGSGVDAADPPRPAARAARPRPAGRPAPPPGADLPADRATARRHARPSSGSAPGGVP